MDNELCHFRSCDEREHHGKTRLLTSQWPESKEKGEGEGSSYLLQGHDHNDLTSFH
jgi:hypothetical protein